MWAVPDGRPPVRRHYPTLALLPPWPLTTSRALACFSAEWVFRLTPASKGFQVSSPQDVSHFSDLLQTCRAQVLGRHSSQR